MRISDWSSDVCSSDLIAANVICNHGVGANQTSASSKGSNTSAVRTLCISMVSALRSGLRLRLRHGAVTSFATCVPGQCVAQQRHVRVKSEEHTSELQSLMRISYAVFCLKKKTKKNHSTNEI